MIGRAALFSGMGLLGLALLGALDPRTFSVLRSGSSQPASTGDVEETPAPSTPLYQTTGARLASPAFRVKSVDPVVIPDCRLTVVEQAQVSSERDGIVVFIGTEVGAREQVPADRLITHRDKRYRRLQEGDVVEAGQLLARLRDDLARADWETHKKKRSAAEADLAAAELTRDEAFQRYQTAEKLRNGKALSVEDYRAARLVYEKYQQEAITKQAARDVARLQCQQAQTVLEQHDIRSPIRGAIKTIYKNPGEAIKSSPAFEPLVHIVKLDRLRVEGMVDVQHLCRLRPGMEVIVEAHELQAPEQTFVGHLQGITGVAVCGDSRRIVSCSEDGTVRVWDRSSRREQSILRCGVPVRSVAVHGNLCLTGLSDGTARVWDLTSGESLRELGGKHRGAIHGVAFSPDGATCATAGEDRAIRVWETASGFLRYRLTGHVGAVTWLQFLPQSELISTGRDNTLRLWTLSADGGSERAVFSRRCGDVTQLGGTPDGRHVLFDPCQSGALRVLSLPDGRTDGNMQNPSTASRFAKFALFSPDAELIVTAGVSQGGMQLWRSPLHSERAALLAQLISAGSPTCAAFSADGAFLVAGTEDRHVLVWKMPVPAQARQQHTGRISYLEKTLDASSRQVRIWAELANPEGRFLPGATATMVCQPDVSDP